MEDPITLFIRAHLVKEFSQAYCTTYSIAYSDPRLVKLTLVLSRHYRMPKSFC